MTFRLKDRIAIVTGAGSRRGIGHAIALGFAKEGATVVVADIDEIGAHATEEELRRGGWKATALQLDVSKVQDVERCIEEVASKIGGIDILVNNAGFCHFMPFLDISEDLWDRTMAVNVKGYFLMGQKVARSMIATGRRGKIINISSISAEVAGEEKVHYSASKGAVRMLTQGMALELARYGINVNAIAPGTIDTDIVRQDRIKALVDSERKHNSIPWGRFGTAEDLVGAAVFLASDESDYLVGSTLLVDGGILAGTLLPDRFRKKR